ncbi:hypothetical protein [Helicobacter sp. T3_23-1059]
MRKSQKTQDEIKIDERRGFGIFVASLSSLYLPNHNLRLVVDDESGFSLIKIHKIKIHKALSYFPHQMDMQTPYICH